MSAATFRNYGGVFHLHLAGPEDLERIDGLDKARWAATSAPIAQFNCDPAFLSAMDADKDGRIRLYDLRDARKWYWERVSNRGPLADATETLRLSDLDGNNADTKAAKALAVLLLDKLGSSGKDQITLAQVRQFRDAYARTFPNGDGVVTPGQIEDADEKAALERIIGSTGGSTDLSGDTGASAADVDRYVAGARGFAAWRARATDEADNLFPLGEDTAAAADLLARLGSKMDQFFSQCALVALEAGATERLQATPEQLAALDVNDPSAISSWLASAPMARPMADGLLRFDGALNPHYLADLKLLAESVGPRLLQREGPLTALRQADWAALKARVSAFTGWRDGQPAGIPNDADPAELVAFADGPMPERLKALAAEDQAVADEIQQFNNLEKLVLYQRWLLEFARNFVTLSKLFSVEERALFQEGLLVIDGRRVQLTMKVTDKAAHRKVAAKSGIFLTYLDIERKNGAGATQKQQVVAAITSGLRGGIDVGKRGVFYDRADQEWDAVVTDVEVNPISLWEAMIAPFVRLKDTIAARIEKAAGDKAGALEADRSKQAEAAQAAAKDAATAAPAAPAGAPAPAAAPPAEAPGNFQNMLIGGSIAFAALASAGALIVNALSSVSPVDLLLIVLGVVALLMAVSAFIAWLRLRKRDLSTFIEAAGFALNGRMYLNRYLAATFTATPMVPKGSKLEQGTPSGTLEKVLLLLVLVVVGVAVLMWQRPDIWQSLLSMM